MATPPTQWAAPSPYPAAQPAGTEELSLQARPMGLKVHYSFDRDNQVHCLARWHQILQIETIPLDEKTTIGVVDLRTCLQAVSQSSPEILNQHENDYSVYAYDYSEPDVPLVGQGLLSWNMDPQRGSQQQQQQLVTGRVTRNLLALLNNGSRDTLEVKLKFATVARTTQRTEFSGMETGDGARSASIPAETVSEWNSFIQSSTMLGHASNNSAVSSPALAPAQLSQYNSHLSESRPMDAQSDSQQLQPIRPATMASANTLQPVAMQPTSRPSSAAAPIPPRPQGSVDNAPSPAASQPLEPASKPRASRPASRSRSKQPTGRPRGRPRKRPLETGNTSAVEEGTDGDDGPQKRRVKVTKTEYSVIAPFGAAPDSLRVAASTSGSLRAMRPVGAGAEASAASHLQDVPRVPTPIPDGQMLQQQQRRRALENQAKAEHAAHFDLSGPGRSMAQNQDARSPAESNVQSPDHGYLPEDSAGDLNSSPPVPRTTPYIQSSPPASSPILPTMPMPQVDSGFMSGGLEDIFDEDILQRLPQEQMQDQMLPVPSLPVSTKPVPRKKGRAQKHQHQQQQQQQQQQQTSDFAFHEVNPGPPELLPTKSIFNPAGKAKTLNRQASSGPPQPVAKPAMSRSLKRSNTAPNLIVPEQETPQEQIVYQQDGNALSHDSAQSYPFEEHLSLTDGMGDSNLPTANDAEKGYPANSPPEPAPAASMLMPIPDRPEPEGISPAQQPSRPASRGLPVQDTEAGMISATSVSEPAPESLLTLPRATASEPPCPPSDLDPPRYSKNLVKKQSIKEKLESAIEKGESPPFCSNCGAIETPTWRKIWTQDHDGVPEFHEFSDKPGCVTMIEVLERDENEQPSKYRMVKKNLGPRDEKRKWVETLLCNPCGIWLGKFKVHRPPERWDKDAARLNQPRRKREPKGKSKKSRTKSENAPPNPTSEAYFTTDPIGPLDHDFLTDHYDNGTQSRQASVTMADEQHLNLRSSPRQRFPGSTHSRGSGTADSPIAVEDQLGSTRRLLFPSPRRDGAPKILGELSLNTTQTTSTHASEAKSASAGKENRAHQERPGTPVPEDELEQELFGTPPRRPSTPPPKAAAAGPFKTPTRPTPNHRPITRSISRSIRSGRGSVLKSPAQLFAFHHLEQTPTRRTPRSSSGDFLHPSSASKRRTPRRSGNDDSAHFTLDAAEHNQLPMGMALQMPMPFDSPFTATLHQLLSEANEFIGGGGGGGDGNGNGSPSRQGTAAAAATGGLGVAGAGAGAGNKAGPVPGPGGHPGGDHHHHLDQLHDDDAGMDFGSFLGTDLVMPSSPPLLRASGKNGIADGNGNGNRDEQFGGVLHEGSGDQVWSQR
ncbi:hypothetical protein VTI28DRAFT_8332 [Corynascus sepedonium]